MFPYIMAFLLCALVVIVGSIRGAGGDPPKPPHVLSEKTGWRGVSLV